MRTPRIYQDIELTTGKLVELEQAATHHLTRVLRLRQNDSIILFNGKGGEFIATLDMEGKKAFARISEYVDISREATLNITLFQGISKGDRMDISLQKAVELGATHIVPIICQRTVVNLKNERREKKYRHWKGIVINACEQSGRTVIPRLDHPMKLADALSQEIGGLKVALDPEANTYLHDLEPEFSRVSLLIGPEGGLTETEISLSRASAFTGIRLGPRVLRTETAALAAIAAMQTQWGDFRK